MKRNLVSNKADKITLNEDELTLKCVNTGDNSLTKGKIYKGKEAFLEGHMGSYWQVMDDDNDIVLIKYERFNKVV